MMYATALLLALTASATVSASKIDEAAIRRGVAELAPLAKVERIRPSALPGVAEVVVDGQVLYVSADGRHALQGTLVSTHDRRDLTEVTRTELRAGALDRLPAEARIRYAPQSPAHRVTVFTAVDCGYCRRFHSEIDRYLAAGIAIDYVLVPLGGSGSDADRVSAQVHCAADRQQAFTAATFGKPLEAGDCESSYAIGVSTASSLGIHSTPTILADDGRMLGGYLTPEQLLERLAKAD